MSRNTRCPKSSSKDRWLLSFSTRSLLSMSKFYKVPSGIFNPIGKCEWFKGSVLLPLDFTGELKKQIQEFSKDEIITNELEQDVTDIDWWAQYKNQVDWVIAITQGNKEYTQWVTDCGVQIARRGVCILDRLTFLEPTKTRENFLEKFALTNIKVLSPRPAFRADEIKAKDSVTSAWFVFTDAGEAKVRTAIDYSINWQNSRDLRL